ncbi:DUF4013 domain-containing protein [Methanobrevibacter sp.]|uniref:DUF4013 domain-containing protein n=1 Tax=Methanobrevibacter sp. TaxID=66852 RepID=UPI003890C83C
MPWNMMREVWDYCTYNMPFFILILALFVLLNYIQDYYKNPNGYLVLLVVVLMAFLIYGYGMLITRDRIKGGVRLPKIIIKDVLDLGIKSTIVFIVYISVQGFVMHGISSPLHFPDFELEELLLNIPHTVKLVFSHSPVDSLIFFVVGAILFYILAFFMEIGLARLAYTGRILSAFNLLDIKRDIDLIGWKHYAKEYTIMIVSIVVFLSLGYIVIPDIFLNYVWNTVLFLFAFATQFLGIGGIYSEVIAVKSE